MEKYLRFLRRLAVDTRGNIMMLFGLMIIPLVLAGGAAVDYARGAQFRAQLQGVVDQAAVSGAAALSSCAVTSTASTVATNYFNNAKGGLPPNGGFGSGPTVTVTPSSCVSSTTTLSVTVSATTTIANTLMSLFVGTTSITATATAVMPGVTATFNTGAFVSYACDLNSVYWYIVPSAGGVPASSAMHLLWTNNTANPPSNTSFQLAANQQIGFALSNTTGSRPTNLGGCNYGNNGYGAHYGDTQWLYSSLQPPSQYYTTAPGGGSTGSHASGYPTTQDCALYIVQGTTSTTFPSVPQGTCYSSNGRNENYNNSSGDDTCCTTTTTTMSTAMTMASPTCAQLSGNTYQFNWNDMGGNADSYNYGNDMQYTFSCSGGGGSGNGTTNSQPYLTQ